jgi:hypothetical protein
MYSEIVYLFLPESSEGIFERPEKLIWAANKRVFATPVSSFVKVLKMVEFGNFVERTILYNMRCRAKM